MVKLASILLESTDILKKTIPSARMEAELIAAHVLSKDRLYIAINQNKDISPKDADEILSFVRRRAKGEPFAYITGVKEFMSLKLSVNPSVLIPRPETEELTELIINSASDTDIRLLDLCTGSGAIACSLAYYMPKLRALGVDISPDAILTATQNAASLGLADRVSFAVADVLKQTDFGGKYDIVVSNPPYIKSDDISKLDTDVKDYEPLLALDGGESGLDFYSKIIAHMPNYLKKGGMLFFEIGYNQGEELKAMLKPKFTDIRLIKDYSGHNRIVSAQLI